MIRALEYPDRWAEADRKALIEAMGECLSDEYLPVRYRASQALLMVGSDAVAVLPALIRAAEKEESLTKVNAIGARSNIGPGSKAAIPVLAKLLEADDNLFLCTPVSP